MPLINRIYERDHECLITILSPLIFTNNIYGLRKHALSPPPHPKTINLNCEYKKTYERCPGSRVYVGVERRGRTANLKSPPSNTAT